jgi:hypothetical protein
VKLELTDFVIPPDEPRYTQPPTAEYRNPPNKREWGAKPGMQGSMAGPMGQ